MQYYSQYGQDRFIHEAFFDDKRNGRFVEFGALDGLLDSNSLFFEREKNWTGILIEPNPDAYRLLTANRPHAVTENVALSDTEAVLPFRKIAGRFYGWSGLEADLEPEHRLRIEQYVPVEEQESIDVEVRTLAWVAKKHDVSCVDLMTIDTEGAEDRIMRAFPWDAIRVSVFCIENNFRDAAIAQLMTARGFLCAARTGSDEIYYDPSVFPGYSPSGSRHA